MGGYYYSEVLSSSKAGDLVSGRNPKLVALDLLPKTSWWKLFIDRKYHKEATPCLLFDRQKSKGFHAVMMRVFKSELYCCLGERLNFRLYERMYLSVSTDVEGIQNRGRSGTNAVNSKGVKVGATNFPTEIVPSEAAIQELYDEGIGCWDIVGGRPCTLPGAKACLMHTGLSGWRIYINYTTEEAPGLANGLFDRYYDDLALAGLDNQHQVRAIARLVRALHTYHFFQDANGRLNTMVVLNKLLLENGFAPTIVCNPAIFGGALTLDRLVKEIFKGMRPVLQEMEAHLKLAHLDLAL